MLLKHVVQQQDDGHSERVSQLVYQLSLALGFTEKDCNKLRAASLYHDVGKKLIPAHILHAKRLLTVKERAIMKRHVEYGLLFLSSKTGDIAEIARTVIQTHHEKWDGTGYPRGLKGEEIPLAGRIVAICDVYDALRSERAYRSALEHDKVIAYMLKNSGTHFDPGLVETFLGLFEQQEAVAMSAVE